MSIVRDLAIILLAVESLVIGVMLIILVWEIRNLAKLLREEIKLKKATGRELLRKKEKEDLREQVRQGLVKKSLPTPAVYDVCWNFSTGTVLFFSCSTGANDEFTQFFLRSFELKPVRLTPAVLAEHVCAEQRLPLDLRRLAESLSDGQ